MIKWRLVRRICDLFILRTHKYYQSFLKKKFCLESASPSFSVALIEKELAQLRRYKNLIQLETQTCALTKQ